MQRYEKADVALENRHNVIVSIKNGLLLYESTAEMETDLGYKGRLSIPFPNYLSKGDIQKLRPRLVTGNDITTIKGFIIHLNNHLRVADSYYPEPGEYFM